MNLLGHGNLESILQDPSAKPRALRLQQLKEITNNFSKDRQFGKGGFGIVYKGLLPNGRVVAVKDLIMSQLQEKQFKREVDNLMKVQHKNIVRFLGYCYESSRQYIEYEAKHVFAESPKMLLCFEYVANGSLDKYINVESCGFDWHRRYKIIKGICHGLHYLHEECQPHGSVIHLDLKPENILLDDRMVPKIADFGISKFFSDQKLETRATIAIGSLGYMAPEYINGNIVSKMADIYSLGVIIMQIITERRVDVTSCEDIVESVLENWSKRMEAKKSISDYEQIRTCLKIGIQCVEFIKEDRPSIKEILQILSTCKDINNGYTSDKETYKELGEVGAQSNPATAREETAEEMVARVGGIMVPAALDAVRAAAGLPGRWEEIAGDLEELRACLLNPSSHPCLANNNALCRVVLQSVAHTLAVVTDLPARCREPQTEGKLRSAVNKVALQLDVNLRDCKLLVKIGELYDAASSPPLLVDATSSSSCVDVKELQRLFAWMEMSHTEAKHFALDGLLEALKKDETRVVSMLHIDNVSAVVKLLAASWPAVIREKAATVACHVAGSDDKCVLLEAELEDELIRLVESGSVVGRQKAAVTLQHLTSKSRTAAWYIVFHGGVGPLIGMCQSQSAAAITGWICGFADLPQLLAGIVRVMVGLLQYCGGDDASESAECLKTAGGDYSVSQLAAASTLKNISTAPLLQQSLQDHGIVRVMVGLLRSGDAVPALKEQAAECLANLASGENNNDKLRRAFVSEGALPALVQLLDPTRNANTNTNTAKKHAIHCLLSLAATDRCRKLIISHGAKGHLAKLSEMNVPGAAALLYRLERGTLAGIISSSNQESFTASVLFD